MGVHGWAIVVFFDRQLGVVGGSALVEHDLFFFIEDQRAFGAHNDFAIAAEAVSIDRRIGDNHAFVFVVFVGRNSFAVRLPTFVRVEVFLDVAFKRTDIFAGIVIANIERVVVA